MRVLLIRYCLLSFACCSGLAAQQPGRAGKGGPKQLAELTASDGSAGADFGYSIAISGNTVAVGAPAADQSEGAVYVFVRPASGWTNMTQVAKLTASDGAPSDNLGFSVSISGKTVVAGAPYKNGDQGAAYVFVEPLTGWANTTETAELTASDGAPDVSFGLSVSVSARTIVAGAPGATIGSNFDQGAAYVFVRPATGWASMTQTSKLTASDGSPADSFGYSVSVSGSTVVAGATYWPAQGQLGAAYVFVKPAAGWTGDLTQTAELTASDGQSGDHLGTSVSATNNTVVAGSPGSSIGSSGGSGAAYVFVEPATGWVNSNETAKLVPSDVEAGDMGSSVSISASTSMRASAVAAGAPGTAIEYEGQGAVFVFGEPPGGWVSETQIAKLKASDPRENNSLGQSVSVYGTTIVAGSPHNTIGSNQSQGAAYVFGP